MFASDTMPSCAVSAETGHQRSLNSQQRSGHQDGRCCATSARYAIKALSFTPEPGRGGGLQLDPQSVQTAPRLSVAEVFALLISVASMRAAGYLPFSNLADAGLAKIEKALPSDKVRDLRRFLDLLVCRRARSAGRHIQSRNDGPGIASCIRKQHFFSVYTCVLNTATQKGQRAVDFVEPQAMLILPPLWYLVAWDPAQEDFRHFRMDRISEPHCVEGKKVQATKRYFQRWRAADKSLSVLKFLQRICIILQLSYPRECDRKHD